MNALGHRRGDKYLFANQKTQRGLSYRSLWQASGSRKPFELWLQEKGLLAS